MNWPVLEILTGAIFVAGLGLEFSLSWIFHRRGPSVHTLFLKIGLLMQTIAAVIGLTCSGTVLRVIGGVAAVSLVWSAMSYVNHLRLLRVDRQAVQSRKQEMTIEALQ